jgi:hypothetical protein
MGERSVSRTVSIGIPQPVMDAEIRRDMSPL